MQVVKKYNLDNKENVDEVTNFLFFLVLFVVVEKGIFRDAAGK